MPPDHADKPRKVEMVTVGNLTNQPIGWQAGPDWTALAAYERREIHKCCTMSSAFRRFCREGRTIVLPTVEDAATRRAAEEKAKPGGPAGGDPEGKAAEETCRTAKSTWSTKKKDKGPARETAADDRPTEQRPAPAVEKPRSSPKSAGDDERKRELR